MTLSPSHHVREQFEHCLAGIRHASIEICSFLMFTSRKEKTRVGFWNSSIRPAGTGWLDGREAKRLNLNDAEMTDFTLQLRLLQQRVPQYENGQDVTQNQLIAAMRFVTALEHLRLQQPLLGYSTELKVGGEAQQQQAHKQVRALELMLNRLSCHGHGPTRCAQQSPENFCLTPLTVSGAG